MSAPSVVVLGIGLGAPVGLIVTLGFGNISGTTIDGPTPQPGMSGILPVPKAGYALN